MSLLQNYFQRLATSGLVSMILVNNLGFHRIDASRLPLSSSNILGRHQWGYIQVKSPKIR